jgi:hypothetical protein
LNRISCSLNMDPISSRIPQYVVVQNIVSVWISSLLARPRIQYVNSREEQHDCVLTTSGKAEPMQGTENVFPYARCSANWYTNLTYKYQRKHTHEMLIAKRDLRQTRAFVALVTLPVFHGRISNEAWKNARNFS